MKKFLRAYLAVKVILAVIAVFAALYAPAFLAANPPKVSAAVATPRTNNAKTTIQRSAANPAAKVPKKPAVAVKAGNYVIDEAGVLNADGFRSLENTLAQYTAKTGTYFAVAVRKAGMTKSGIGNYANQFADRCAAKAKNGAIVFVQDTQSRLWYIATDKIMKPALPKDEHVEYISGAVVPYLKNNDPAAAYRAFALKASELSAYYTQNHKAMQVVDKTPARLGVVALALFFAYLFAAARRSSLVNAMSNVRFAHDADDYVKKESFSLVNRDETFLYNTVTVVPRPKKTSGGGGVGFSSANSGHGGGGGSY